jgi:curli biogenesis system outer membrane secretion channel CsgG
MKLFPSFKHLSLLALLLAAAPVLPAIAFTTPQAAPQSAPQSASQAAPQAEPQTIAQAQRRMRIAVLDFEYASTGQTWSWWGGVAPSQGVSDLLTNKLVDGGAYTLIERSRIEAVLAEQNLGAAGRLDASTAAEIGRILGADAVVLGSVTRYNLNQGSNGTSVLGVSVGRRRDSASVELTARLVNTTTSEILATATGSGEARQGSGGVSVGGLFSTASDNSNTDELISNAAQAAVDQLATQLTEKADVVAAAPMAVTSVSALVADVAGSTVIINKGSRDGFQVGMTVTIERVTREVKDPTTGQVIRTVTTPVGRVELTSVDAGSSEGRIVSGNGMQVGDRAIAQQ